MTPFNLEKALAGEKVVTRDGREITQFHMFSMTNLPILYGYDDDNDTVEQWFADGKYHHTEGECGGDLFMAPKKLIGFVVVYSDGVIGGSHSTKAFAELAIKQSLKRVDVYGVAIIDLSQFEEGHGL